jgi:hypothetical protein
LAPSFGAATAVAWSALVSGAPAAGPSSAGPPIYGSGLRIPPFGGLKKNNVLTRLEKPAVLDPTHQKNDLGSGDQHSFKLPAEQRIERQPHGVRILLLVSEHLGSLELLHASERADLAKHANPAGVVIQVSVIEGRQVHEK